MPIIATAGESKDYTPAPAGAHIAVCVDILDLGMKPNPFRDGALQRKIDIAWQIDELRDDGKRHVVYKRYTLSLHEKAALRHDLESWRGRPFTAQEERGFDVESIKGANCILSIQHVPGTKDPSKTFARVVSVMPLMKGMPKLVPVGYERPVAKDAVPSPVHDQQPSDDDGQISYDDIPFAWAVPVLLPALLAAHTVLA